MKKLAFDVDGTILNDTNKISQELGNFLEDHSKENDVYFLTGRSYLELLHVIKPYKISNGYAACSNGAVIYSFKEEKLINTTSLDDNSKRYVCHIASVNSFSILAYGEKILLTYAFNESNKQNISRITYIPNIYFSDYYKFMDRIIADKIYAI